MKNGNYKKGDILILKKSGHGNGSSRFEGQQCKVVSKSSRGYYTVNFKGNSNHTIYFGYSGIPSDDFCLVSRKEQAKYCREQAKKLEKEVKELLEEAESLEMFKDDEEETAFKLKRIFDKKNDVKAMAEILRELKSSNFL